MRVEAWVESGGVLGELLVALEGVDCRREPDRVSALLAALRPSSHELQRLLKFRAGRYTRTLLHRDRRFELVLVCWSRGAQSTIHDHDGQDCWLLPLAGALDLEDFAVTRNGLERIAHRPAVRTLDHRSGDAQIHRVSAATAAAVSLHVYAAPVDRCRVYDRRGHWRWRNLGYDFWARLNGRASPGAWV
jgi:cysteine dioxygenase